MPRSSDARVEKPGANSSRTDEGKGDGANSYAFQTFCATLSRSQIGDFRFPISRPGARNSWNPYQTAEGTVGDDSSRNEVSRVENSSTHRSLLCRSRAIS